MPTKVKELPLEEMELRWRRARERMDEDGLDAILVTEKGNFGYFSGARVSTQWANKMRPNIAIVPRKGDPALLIYSLEKPRTIAASHVPNVQSYVDAPFPPADAIELLKSLGLENGKIGMEYGESQRMWFSQNHLEDIKAGMPGAEFVDGSGTIEWLRLHKTPVEIEKLKAAAVTSQRALERLYPTIQLGMTARQITQQLTIFMLEEGADLRAPGNIGGEFNNWPDDYVMQKGDVIRFDFGAIREGYWADICRRVALVENERAQRDQEVLWKMITACQDALGPDILVSRIHQIHNQQAEAAGFPGAPSAKRIGHGLGIDASEPPSLSAEDDTVLEPGMVVTLEPRFPSEYGTAHIEETYVITEDGYEMISSGQSQFLTIVGK